MNYQAIIDMVIKASEFALDGSLSGSVDMKGSADFVTAADLKISAYVKEQLKTLSPGSGFMSEEEQSDPGSEYWILDPVDGTTNLVYGYGMSSVSLAHFDGEKVDFGVIYNPFNKELFTAKSGEGVYLNGKKVPPAPDRQLSDCIIEFGAGSTCKQYTEQSFAVAKEVFTNCLDLRRICSTALAIAYVACGRINGYFERVIKPWDYAAASLMLKECGCVCSDWNSKPVPYHRCSSSYVCGTPKAYDFLVKTIQKYDNK
ncbi:MAG: inositol monophosphatase [Ruminococcaceae bacterium]|nr:inositol monophosphatase [Oscillospiraceae bacterium]